MINEKKKETTSRLEICRPCSDVSGSFAMVCLAIFPSPLGAILLQRCPETPVINFAEQLNNWGPLGFWRLTGPSGNQGIRIMCAIVSAATGMNGVESDCANLQATISAYPQLQATMFVHSLCCQH